MKKIHDRINEILWDFIQRMDRDDMESIKIRRFHMSVDEVEALSIQELREDLMFDVEVDGKNCKNLDMAGRRLCNASILLTGPKKER